MWGLTAEPSRYRPGGEENGRGTDAPEATEGQYAARSQGVDHVTTPRKRAPKGPNLRSAQVAKMYGRSVKTLGVWRARNYGPPCHLGPDGFTYLYPQAEAIEWGRANGYIDPEGMAS